MSSSNVAWYAVHSRTRTYALMHFSSNQAVKFGFALDVVLRATGKNCFEFISSWPRSQSFVGCEPLLFRNGGIDCSTSLRAFSRNEFTIAAGWEHGGIGSNCTHVVPSVEGGPIGSASSSNEATFMIYGVEHLWIGRRRLRPASKPSCSRSLNQLLRLKSLQLLLSLSCLSEGHRIIFNLRVDVPRILL